jgi:hypothetical protein
MNMNNIEELYDKIEGVRSVLLDLADCDYETALQNVKEKEEAAAGGVEIMNDYETQLFWHELRNDLGDAIEGIKQYISRIEGDE